MDVVDCLCYVRERYQSNSDARGQYITKIIGARNILVAPATSCVRGSHSS